MSAPFAAILVEGVDKAAKKLDPVAFWERMELSMPGAFQPLANRLQSTAPVGKTGKLARGPFGIRIKRRSQALIAGVEVAVGASQPTAHLVAGGHAIVPRGPTVLRKRFKREQRAAIRAGVKARRAAGAIGFVPGNPFVEQSWTAERALVVERVERDLAAAFGR